jgi:hypothetical protein
MRINYCHQEITATAGEQGAPNSVENPTPLSPGGHVVMEPLLQTKSHMFNELNVSRDWSSVEHRIN